MARARRKSPKNGDALRAKHPNQPDVVIPEHDFAMQWNLSKDGGLWIMAIDSVNQIGCIHTCQGLEVDYIGVIVGPDMIVRDGKLLTCPENRSRHDQSLSGYKKLLKVDEKNARGRADVIIKNTYRTLMTRGMKGCYVHFTDKETAEYFRGRLFNSDSNRAATTRTVETVAATPGPVDNILPFERLELHAVSPYVNAVPLVDLKFAAGAFGETQVNTEATTTWVSLPDFYRPRPGLFVAQVIGESMNRRIPNGAWCLFRMHPGGTRQGKVVVAQHRNIHDPDLGGSYTVKVYQSEKKRVGDGGWAHARITLKPDSTDVRFVELGFGPDTAEGLTVVAELIAVL